jgi:hypothetical protein
MSSTSQYKLEEITWLDPKDYECSEDELCEQRPVTQMTMGYNVFEDKEKVLLSNNIDDRNDHQGTLILKVLIKERKVVKCKSSKK